MSTITNSVRTRNQLTSDYDVSKLFLGNNESISGTFTSSGGDTLYNGHLMGKVAVGGAIVECNPSASDGSQFPIGLINLGLSESVDVADGAAIVLNLINTGRVASSKIILPTGVLLTTVISGDGRTISDYLNALGFTLEGGEELTALDNH
jgi:hypothetical protein